MEGATFGYLVNRVAFVDTIRLSVWTDKNPIFRQLVDERNDPIGSRRSKYSRRLSGKSPYSGNPTTVLYGRKVRFSSVPPYRMRIDSKEAPVTAAEVNEIIRRIFPDARRVDVSQADITFDLRRESVRQLFRSVMHRARQWTELSNLSGKTIYIGSPRSAWEIRLYNKRSNVVRFEVMLRRPFLSANGIQRPDSVIAVRSVPLPELFSMRRVSRVEVVERTKDWEPDWRELVLDREIFSLPLPLLRRRLGLRNEEIGLVFPPSRLQRTMEIMQRGLVW